MEAAVLGQVPSREAECSYDFEAEIYFPPRAGSGLKLLPAVVPALLLAVLAAFRLR